MEKVSLDYFARHKYLADLQHCGQSLAFKLHGVDLEQDRYTTALWLYQAGAARQLLAELPADYFFLNEKEIAFEAKRSEADKALAEAGAPLAVYHRLEIATGKISELFRVERAALSCRPVGPNRYLLVTEDNHSTNALWQQAGGRLDVFRELMAEEANYIVADEMPFRADWRVATNRVRQGLYLWENGSLRRVSGEYEDVEYATVFGEDYALFSSITFTDVRQTESLVYRLDLATGQVSQIAEDAPYVHTSLQAVDAQHALLLRNDKALHGEYQDEYIDLVELATGKLVARLNGESDLTLYSSVLTDLAYGAGSVAFGSGSLQKTVPDGAGGVYFAATVGDSVRILHGEFATGKITKVTPPQGKMIDFAILGGALYFIAIKEDRPGELYRFELETGAEERLTDFNQALYQGTAIAPRLPIRSKSGDGTEIDGYYIKPLDFEEGKKYPALLYIHGGPNQAYSNILFHEMQLMAARGYGIFFCNPRGSIGRGGSFADIRKQHYTVDYMDIMDFARHCVANLPWVDENRLGVTGGSYGGIMTNWIITHSNMFKAAVSDRSVCNELTSFLLADIGFSMVYDSFGETPWTNPGKMLEYSAITHAPKASTPTLFIHGVDDFRCEVDQSYQLFAALKYHGVPARVVAFRGSTHGLSRSGSPKKRLRRLKEICAWFDHYI